MKTIILLISFLSSTTVFAAGEISTQTPSNRMAKPLGAGLSVGNPFPSVLGINGSYNVADFLRAQVAYGEIEVTSGMSISSGAVTTTTTKATTLAAGATAFVPGLNLSPVASLSVSHISYEGDGEIEIQGIKKSGTLLYGSLGVDWQAESGFNAALGYHFGISQATPGNLYASLGWFFSI